MRLPGTQEAWPTSSFAEVPGKPKQESPIKNETNLRPAAIALAILAALASLQSAQARDASHGNTSKGGASNKTASTVGGLDNFGRDGFAIFAVLDLQ